jgi:hypothetical protein
MRPPPRSQFHHSDLGGPFAAFAPELRESDQGLNREADSRHSLSYPTRHQRWSVLSILIDAFRRRRANPVSPSRQGESLGPASGRTDDS